MSLFYPNVQLERDLRRGERHLDLVQHEAAVALHRVEQITTALPPMEAEILALRARIEEVRRICKMTVRRSRHRACDARMWVPSWAPNP